MKPNLAQQALAGLAVLFVVLVTVVGGILLAFSDNMESADVPATRPPATQRPQATQTPVPTEMEPTQTPTQVPTATVVTATPLPSSATPAPITETLEPLCSIPSDWVPYIVQAGDTLYDIGMAYGLTVDELEAANCLPWSRLAPGDVVYVPPIAATEPATPRPTLTSVPTSGATPTPSTTDGICTNPNSMITSPTVGDTISGTTLFYGTAAHEAFSFYKLEIRPESSSPDDFVTFFDSSTPVYDGQLGQLITTAFENGEYWVRLVVVDTTSNYPERCSILYMISN